jgi:non-ribosomal peptide synthetase component E (peptide arylation enzyme)
VEYVAVVGMPDPDLGEKICAYVKLVQGATLSHEDIHQHLKTMEAANIHYPERTIFVSEIPLTAAGKADKKILKKDIEEILKVEALE